jgi:Domain of unknown function (DUF4150)
MGKKVYANGMEIAAKSGSSKVIAAFPDVCMSPPSPPAGPLPVPYPNTSSSADLKKGTKTVKIGGQPASIGDQSFYKTSPLGDEAATRSFGAAVVTHGITGKTYFGAHSMDVELEGKSVNRHLDITTSNHSSYPGSTPPMPTMEGMVQLALERIAENKCPCCGATDCPAAFKEGEEAQSFEDFYKLNEPHPSTKAKFKGTLSDRATRRNARLTEINAGKAASCSCTPGNRVFPQPPCDVFREPDPKRTPQIEAKWDLEREEYRKAWGATNGRPLRTASDVTAAMRAEAGGSFTDAQAKSALTKANKQTRINHLVPKEAGGCPTNPGNLQPQDELCSFCQGVDDEFTAKWQ